MYPDEEPSSRLKRLEDSGGSRLRGDSSTCERVSRCRDLEGWGGSLSLLAVFRAGGAAGSSLSLSSSDSSELVSLSSSRLVCGVGFLLGVLLAVGEGFAAV